MDDGAVLHPVTLPDGRSVLVSSTPQSWWTENEAHGYVDPAIIAPDPDQPRRHMNEDRLAELRASIAECGVRQPVIVTPRHLAPWARVNPEDEDKYFLNVSGHRRVRSAFEEHQGAVPVLNRIYPNQDAHETDRSVLNAGHEELSEIEEGLEMVGHRKRGWTIEKIGNTFGKSAPLVYNRMNLTKLHPDIQERLSPKLDEKKRLSVGVAGELGGLKMPTQSELFEAYRSLGTGIPGYEALVEAAEENFDEEEESELTEEPDEEGPEAVERRFAMQKFLLAIVDHRRLAAVRAISFIKDQKNNLEASRKSTSGRPTERFQPARRKDIIRGLVSSVTRSPVMDWTPKEFERIFDLSAREEIEVVIGQLAGVTDFIGGLVKVLERLRDKKKPLREGTIEVLESRGMQHIRG